MVKLSHPANWLAHTAIGPCSPRHHQYHRPSLFRWMTLCCPVKMPLDIHAVLRIPEITDMIMGYVENRAELHSAYLTRKSFNAAARSHLWRTIDLPNLLQPGRPFWERALPALEHHTRCIRVDMNTVAPGVLENVRLHDPALLAVQDVDKLFYGLEQTLMRAKRLRSFTSYDVPRILDIVVLSSVTVPPSSPSASGPTSTITLDSVPFRTMSCSSGGSKLGRGASSLWPTLSILASILPSNPCLTSRSFALYP